MIKKRELKKVIRKALESEARESFTGQFYLTGKKDFSSATHRIYKDIIAFFEVNNET